MGVLWFFAVQDNPVDAFAQEREVLLGVFVVLSDDQPGLRVLRDVVAGGHAVGCVYSDGDAAGEDGAHVCDDPLRGIEADEVDHGEFGVFQAQQHPREFEALSVIFLKGERDLNGQRGTHLPPRFTESAGSLPNFSRAVFHS